MPETTPSSEARLAVMEQTQFSLQADLREIKELLREAVAVGQEDRRQLNDRLVRLEVRSETLVSFRQLISWMGISAAGAVGVAQGIQQMLAQI